MDKILLVSQLLIVTGSLGLWLLWRGKASPFSLAWADGKRLSQGSSPRGRLHQSSDETMRQVSWSTDR